MSWSQEEREIDHRPPAPGWMITFADLLSLLLAFFVLMFATTAVEEKDWQRVVVPISTYLTGHTIAAPEASVAPPAGPAHIDLDYIAALLARLAADSSSLSGAAVERAEHVVLFRLPVGLAWQGGDPAPLADLARLLADLDNRVEVRVHTVADPSPHADPLIDWRRSLAHAVAVSAELARLGAKPLPASGSVDLAGALGDEQIVILIEEAAGEVSHVAP
jgi:chemotaxis protein MotB